MTEKPKIQTAEQIAQSYMSDPLVDCYIDPLALINAPSKQESRRDVDHSQIQSSSEQEIVSSHSTSTQNRRKMVQTMTNRKQATARRRDSHLKNLPQNISSFCKTCIPKILSKGDRVRREELRNKFLQFLANHQSVNSQLIIIFANLFMRQQQAKDHEFSEFRKELDNYLDKRVKESEQWEEEQSEAYVHRININKKLLSRYFDGTNQEIDIEWLQATCSSMFTKRQRETIGKPLKKLEQIQRSLATTFEEFPPCESYPIKAPFELDSDRV